jgi:hypothetical protein
MLGAAGPAVVAAGLHTERLRYERGTLELEVTLPAGTGRDALERRLAVPGYRTRVERTSVGPAGEVALLVFAAES